MQKIILFFSSVCGVGYIKYASGTFGSALALIFWLFIPANYKIQALFIIVAIIISVITSSYAERVYDNIDDHRIVIDELCGMWISVFMLPKTPFFLIAGFFLFRFFDVKKPFFINKLQELKSGLGVTADDIAAGIFANIILQIVLIIFQHNAA